MMSVVVLLMGNRTDPALAAKATPKSNRFTTVSSKPDEVEGLHTLYSSVGNVGEGAQKTHPGFLGPVGMMLSRLQPKPSRPKIVYSNISDTIPFSEG